ncbi:MAG: hypothetical protein JWQ87_3627 [Candidatus Sulfotelmatobacter sp.]|nr:hypothetical protein [Candidatus Sulfotelmatobacter sp.]
MKQPESQGTPQAQSASIISFRGEDAQITMVPFFVEGAIPDPREAAGYPGKYKLIVTLSRPRYVAASETVYKWAEDLKGDSHLAITRPAYTPPSSPDAVKIKVRVWGDNGFYVEYDGTPNEKGYLGKLESEPFDANDFRDAEVKAYTPLLPILSNWSVHLDIPIYVAQIEIAELRTGARSGRLFTPPAESSFAVKGELTFKPGSEFAHYASLYREALNSNSAPYRYLCLFKIIEAIRVRRERLANESVRSGQKPRSLVERVPASETDFQNYLDPIYHIREWHSMALSQVFPPAIRGKKFNQIIDDELRPLRDKVAHGIMDSGELGISADDLVKVERVNFWLPLTRTMVRRMLKNDFGNEFLSYLVQA